MFATCSLNNPTCPPEPWRRWIGFSDPSGADPDPDYQNPNHQYYFHNGAGSAGYPGLTYDDVVPQAARGEFNSAFGWRQDTMLGWFNGSGPGLNAGSFGSQTIRYMTGLAREMANLTMAALNRGDGVTLMNFSRGHLTSSDYKSTAVFFREVGRELAREYYGGEGRMAEGYMPANYNLFPSVGQVVGMLPGQMQDGVDLDAFRSKYFGNVNGLASIYGSTPPGYDLVNGAFVKNGDPDRKPVSGVTSYLGNGKSNVYISPNSMTTNRELFLVMGHEFVHVYHYAVFGANLNLGFSENAAYQWSIDASAVNGWNYYENIYSNIQKNDWPNSNASYDYLISGISLVFPK